MHGRSSHLSLHINAPTRYTINLDTDVYCMFHRIWLLSTVMCNGLPRTTLSYSGDALRSFNVQPTSQLRRDVRKRLFSLRIWSPRYKHVKLQSFDHSVTVRKYVPGVKLGVINCQSISGKLDFVFDHIKEYQLDIVALTETWLSSEDSKNKHVIDQCVAHGYSLHHSPRTSGRRGGGVGLLVINQGDL